jgi:hypothetical protein
VHSAHTHKFYLPSKLAQTHSRRGSLVYRAVQNSYEERRNKNLELFEKPVHITGSPPFLLNIAAVLATPPPPYPPPYPLLVLLVSTKGGEEEA